MVLSGGRRITALLLGCLILIGGTAAIAEPRSGSDRERAASTLTNTITDAWSVTMFAEKGEYLGRGVDRHYDESNGTLRVSSTGTNGAKVWITGGPYNQSYGFDFAAADYGHLTPGFYPDAQAWPFQDPGRPGISISGDGRGCSDEIGNFEVRDIAWSADRTIITRLWILYEQHCGEGKPALFGEIRFGASMGSVDVESDAVRWPETYRGQLGKSVPLRVRQRGNAAAQVSTIALDGAHPTDFVIDSNECSGLSLDVGKSCLVSVRFAPSVAGPRTARLRITTSAGTFQVPLDGYGLPGVTEWSFTSTADDPIGGGGTYLYTAPRDAFLYRGSSSRISGSVTAANGDLWNTTFAPARNDALAEGRTYDNAQKYPTGDAVPSMYVSRSTGCTTINGSFTVTQLGISPVTGALDRIDVSFRQTCDGKGSLQGRMRYRARADVTPPARVTSAAATRTGATSARLSWVNPTDTDYASTVVRYLPANNLGSGIATAGYLAYAGEGTGIDVSGLRSNETYSFAIFTYDSTGNVSSARVVTLPGSLDQTLILSARVTTLTYGATAYFGGELSYWDGTPLSKRSVRLQVRPLGTTTWSTVSTHTTSAFGGITASPKPSTSGDYRLLAAAAPGYTEVESKTVRIHIGQKVTAALSRTSITLGQTVTVTGSVAPSHAGQPVQLQRYYSGAWHTLKQATLSSSSTYSFSYTPTSKGTYSLRVYRAGDVDHLAGNSTTLKLTVG